MYCLFSPNVAEQLFEISPNVPNDLGKPFGFIFTKPVSLVGDSLII